MMHWYPIIKTIHISSVILSLSLFSLRGLMMLADSRWLQNPIIKILPHLIDTVLLASAVTLAVLIHQYPLVHAWLTVKVLALVVYIVLGTIALKRGRTKTIRATAWLAALAVFGFIISVAVRHNPWGVLLNLF